MIGWKKEKTTTKRSLGTSQAVQWLRIYTSSSWGSSSIPGQGTKILHAEKNGQKKVLNLIMKYVLCVCHKLRDIGIYFLSFSVSINYTAQNHLLPCACRLNLSRDQPQSSLTFPWSTKHVQKFSPSLLTWTSPSMVVIWGQKKENLIPLICNICYWKILSELSLTSKSWSSLPNHFNLLNIHIFSMSQQM